MKKYFLTGLALFLPVMSTVFIIVWLYDLLTKPFLGLTIKLFHVLGWENMGFWMFSSEEVLQWACRFIIMISLVLFTLGLGYFIRYFLIHTLVHWGEKLVHKIPMVRTVYSMVKDIIKTLLTADKKSLKQVVIVPFANTDIYCLGLVSKDSPKVCQTAANESLISIFIPSTPNPTTGFVVMYPQKDLVYLDMKPEEAIKFIVSLGVIQPEEQAP